MAKINTSDLGGMLYPFLHLYDDDRWELHSHHLGYRGLKGLSWLKDDKILEVQGITYKDLQENYGFLLQPSLKGDFDMSKRLSRVLRPGFFFFYPKSVDIRIIDRDPKIWDGIGTVSRAFVRKCDVPLRLMKDGRRKKLLYKELETVKRVEITIVDCMGQYKGHAIVVEDQIEDFICAPGQLKQGFSLSNKCFASIYPVHGHESMFMDVQSLVNLVSFFGVDQIKDWLDQWIDWAKARIESGEAAKLVSLLNNIDGPEDIAKLQKFPVGEFLASGGNQWWFPKTVRTAARMVHDHIESMVNSFRFPIPGSRKYIIPASVFGKTLPDKTCEIDETNLIVSDESFITCAGVTGGADCDDGYWVHQYSDMGKVWALCWRSPNKRGEYFVLEVTNPNQTWLEKEYIPKGDDMFLPPHDDAEIRYGALNPLKISSSGHYSLENIERISSIAKANEGVLGAYVNMLMLISVTQWADTIKQYPATLEAVIDGTIKHPMNLTPVKMWIKSMSETLASSGVPECMRARLSFNDRAGASIISDHWMDKLSVHASLKLLFFKMSTEALTGKCQPPAAMLEEGQDHIDIGLVIRKQYGDAVRTIMQSSQDLEFIEPDDEIVDFDVSKAIKSVCADLRAQYPREEDMLGLLAAIFTASKENKDSALWSVYPDMLITWMKHNGYMGEIEWDGYKPVIMWNNPQLLLVPSYKTRATAVWYNQVAADKYPFDSIGGKLSAIPEEERDAAKQVIKAASYQGATLVAQFEGIRQVLYLGDKKFGYLPKDSKLKAGAYKVIASRSDNDGNVDLSLEEA